jgi:glycosyltransferase involved in cell wall biosynthesis
MSKIPVSAIIVAKNEEANIGRCLEALSGFDEIVIVDSNSQDATVKIARDKGARIFPFYWNGRYPKKRQWALENIDISHDWVFFVDADEVVTQKLSKSIKRIFENGTPRYVGYFIKGCYVWKGKLLSFGMTNNKLALFDRRYIEFPLVNDLDIPGMGEIEGHYQPVLKKALQI